MNERITERFEPVMRDLNTANRVGMLALAVATITGIVVCVLLAKPFLGALTWALALAIVFAPLHGRIEASLKHRNLAAVISVSIIALVIALPTAFVAERLIREALSGTDSVQIWVKSGRPEVLLKRLLDTHPIIAPIINWILQRIDLIASTITQVATSLRDAIIYVVGKSLLQLIEIAVAFYLLFYFLRDRRAAGRLLQEWLPLTNAESGHLFGHVIDTVRATVYGTLALAAAQGILGCLMFWFVGLPMPVIWGVAMGLLSIVPLGAFAVWIPAAVYLALNGSWGSALILTVWGVTVVGGVNNVLYPIFVGNRLRLHTVPTFISIVGGLALFGAPGLILGPLVVTITMLLLGTWKASAPFKLFIVPLDRGTAAVDQPSMSIGGSKSFYRRQDKSAENLGDRL